MYSPVVQARMILYEMLVPLGMPTSLLYYRSAGVVYDMLKLTYLFVDNMCNVTGTLTDFHHVDRPYPQSHLMLQQNTLAIQYYLLR